MKQKLRLLLPTLLLLQNCMAVGQTRHVTKQENLVYGMISGMALLMDVYQPEKSNHRAILYINGSAWGYAYQQVYNQPSLKEDYTSDTAYSGKWAQALVQKGYTLFIINHRFAPSFGFPEIFYDCQRAVRFIRYHAKNFKIDPNHIGVMGHSSGAYLSALLGVTDTLVAKPETGIDSVSSKVQAVVALATPFDLSDFNRREDSSMARDFIAQVLINYLKELPEKKDGEFVLSGRYAQASPVTYVSSDDAPFLIYYSDDDPLIPARQGPAMYQKLKAAGIATRLVLRRKESHTPSPDMEEVDKWFKQYLK